MINPEAGIPKYPAFQSLTIADTKRSAAVAGAVMIPMVTALSDQPVVVCMGSGVSAGGSCWAFKEKRTARRIAANKLRFMFKNPGITNMPSKIYLQDNAFQVPFPTFSS